MRLLLISSIFLLISCSGNLSKESDPTLSYLAKSDIDTVADVHVEEALGYTQILMGKLYRRNPAELRKAGYSDVKQRIKHVFNNHQNWEFAELGNKKSTDCLMLAFDENYTGDRVFAFTVGLHTMIMASYNDKKEFHITDSLDAQKLYNSARNLEIAVWRLSNARDSKGKLFLLSNSKKGEIPNLSYERLFGKLIATQDTIAKITAGKTKRNIKSVIQSLASAVFLPI